MAPIVLITGSSTGIGLSAAVLMAKAGFEVVATMRNLQKAAPLRARAQQEGVQVDIRALDVESDESVRRCVDEVLQRHGRIDVLVNNAGVGTFGSLEQTPLEVARRLMDVNYFGVWRTTQAVLPSMRERRSGRILTVSSIAGLVGSPFNDAYSASKFAIEGMMECLVQTARPLGIHVSMIQPGPVITEFLNNLVGPGLGSTGDMGAYRPLFDAYLSQAQAFYGQWQTGDDVARIVVEAAKAEQPHLRYLTSEKVRELVSRKYADPTQFSRLPHPQLAGS
jgi:NAD(P)-dependent dehydrogenase (short-subunit alcohol dehydrogenase family)